MFVSQFVLHCYISLFLKELELGNFLHPCSNEGSAIAFCTFLMVHLLVHS